MARTGRGSSVRMRHDKRWKSSHERAIWLAAAVGRAGAGREPRGGFVPALPVLLLATLLAVAALSIPRLGHAWCVGGAPPAMDADGDDLNTLQELALGTDPANADTNGNGVPDGNE